MSLTNSIVTSGHSQQALVSDSQQALVGHSQQALAGHFETLRKKRRFSTSTYRVEKLVTSSGIDVFDRFLTNERNKAKERRERKGKYPAEGPGEEQEDRDEEDRDEEDRDEEDRDEEDRDEEDRDNGHEHERTYNEPEDKILEEKEREELVRKEQEREKKEAEDKKRKGKEPEDNKDEKDGNQNKTNTQAKRANHSPVDFNCVKKLLVKAYVSHNLKPSKANSLVFTNWRARTEEEKRDTPGYHSIEFVGGLASSKLYRTVIKHLACTVQWAYLQEQIPDMWFYPRPFVFEPISQMMRHVDLFSTLPGEEHFHRAIELVDYCEDEQRRLEHGIWYSVYDILNLHLQSYRYRVISFSGALELEKRDVLRSLPSEEQSRPLLVVTMRKRTWEEISEDDEKDKKERDAEKDKKERDTALDNIDPALLDDVPTAGIESRVKRRIVVKDPDRGLQDL
ncbi:hypothetical protein GLAREA_03033 [Glarea lozoyensis ATCC 20868]|uniref:Uncharacterized protein n=1 Tax=Glarea lozoyensis (strain ATCC 20868 / MF5171) TaxID=1116229 RepID=S3CPQ1_GLAL2|nr:uncharacterized protein GLAREA_03033 [Glarea lozoyensis ATCC 20868]EPE27119.1 hypothetical protein GLAREA_03033 [Glarea lozoyensis ATCC 20868]